MKRQSFEVGNSPSSTAHKGITLDLQEQLRLTADIFELANNLESSPFVFPEIAKRSLKSICLKSPGENGPATTMSVETSQQQPGVATANICINDPNSLHSRNLQFAPMTRNHWQIFHPANPRALETRTNGEVVDLLLNYLGDTSSLQMLMDQSPDTVSNQDIAERVYQQLYARARVKESETRYTEPKTIASFDHERDTTLMINRKNRVARYTLLMAGVYPIGESHVKKTYMYDIKANGRNFSYANGSVVMTSTDGISNEQLSYYVGQEDDEQVLTTLNNGVDTLTPSSPYIKSVS